MAWGFRKSFGRGPFRVNLSKSGVGVSAGVRGARVSTGPRGTMFTGGLFGVRYTKKLGGRGRGRRPAAVPERRRRSFATVAAAVVFALMAVGFCVLVLSIEW